MRIVGFIPTESDSVGIFEQSPDEAEVIQRKKPRRSKKDEVSENADNGTGVSETQP